LGGLDPKYAHVIELQPFTTFDEVCVLAHKVETQMKSRPYKGDFSKPLPKGQPFNKGSPSYPPKPVTPYFLPTIERSSSKSPTLARSLGITLSKL